MEHPEYSGNRRRPTTTTGEYDTGCQTVGRRSPSLEDAVSECLIVAGPGSPCSQSATQRPRTEVSRLPRPFRYGLSSVERPDCSTPDGHTTQTRQFSRHTVEDVVCIQPPNGNRFGPDRATRPGGWGDRAGKLSSFWRPRLSSHRQTEEAGN